MMALPAASAVEDQVCRLECIVRGGTIRYDEAGEEVLGAAGKYVDSLVSLRLVEEEKEQGASRVHLEGVCAMIKLIIDSLHFQWAFSSFRVAETIRQRLEDIRLDKTVAKIAVAIPIGCYYLNRKITCSVGLFLVLVYTGCFY